MKIHADRTKSAVVATPELEWVPSPLPGVDRKMIEREGGEVARATSLVRYAPGSSFSAHQHGGGEEFLVLEGTFVDEHGEYPAGTYVRNPPGSEHAPSSPEGCVIFVKLRQMHGSQRQRVVLDTAEGDWQRTGEGVEMLPLFADEAEEVRLVRLAPGASLPEQQLPSGREILVLEGEVEDGLGRHAAGTWVRMPAGSRSAMTSAAGGTFYQKEGHLAEPDGSSGAV